MKLWRNSCLVFFFFPSSFFVCLHFFFFRPFIYIFFCSFSTYISENCPQWWATNKQTKKIQSYQLALHSLREVLGMEWRVIVQTVGWTQKGGRRRRRRRKKVNKVHEGWGVMKVQKVQEDRGWLRSWRCVNTPHTTAQGRCVCRRAWLGC